MNFEELQQLTIEWGNDKGIVNRANADKQFMKFIEEVFEFKTEMDIFLDYDSVDECFRTDENFVFKGLANFEHNMKLELGDVFVALVMLSALLGIEPVECLELAYNKISKRKVKQ